MKILFKHGYVLGSYGLEQKDIIVRDGMIKNLIDSGDTFRDETFFDEIVDCKGLYIVPGFVDVHVHFRQPGFEYKETIKTGTMAAAAGGYTSVCTMPNLKPAPVDRSSLNLQLDIIRENAVIKVYPYGAITSDQSGRGELADMESMAGDVVAFSDDGKGVQSAALMKKAMIKAKSLGRLIVAHCEDEGLLNGGYIHNGKYAAEHGHRGICSESEWKHVERDLALAKESRCGYHVCHVSTKESVDLIRRAKAEGVDVTCETAPHYLMLCDDDLHENGKWKMNPPLRSREDQAALIKGIKDGTVDMIATDHAPHSAEEKSKGLENSAFGVVGLEIAFSVLYTGLVKTGLISFDRLVELMSAKPCDRFNINGGIIKPGAVADLSILDLTKKRRIITEEFLTKGRSTPFEGMDIQGFCVMTVSEGKIVYKY